MSCSKGYWSTAVNSGQQDSLIDLTCDESESKKKMKMKKKNDGFNKCRKIISLCKICLDVLPKNMVWSCFKCKHPFCEDCLNNHVMQKFQENDFGYGLSIKCPEGRCIEMLKPRDLIGVIPIDVYERWQGSCLEIDRNSYWFGVAERSFYSMLPRPLFKPYFSPRLDISKTKDVVDLD